jgi:tRNA threonylcarbamoyladenosine biosynthesis protein TsaE
MVPIFDEHTLDFISHSVVQTQRLGARLGELLRSGDVVCLEGELGTGKTCLTQGIGHGLGVTEPITSPTFILANEYHPPLPNPAFYHIDLYRLDDAVREVGALGFEDYLYGKGVCVIEWADRGREALPAECLWISLRYISETKRGISMTAIGERYQRLLQEFKRNAFGIWQHFERTPPNSVFGSDGST